MLVSTNHMRVVDTPQKLERKVESGKMSVEFLREHCRKNDLYMVPHFNTIMYLHHKVFGDLFIDLNLPFNFNSAGLPGDRKFGRVHRVEMFVPRKQQSHRNIR